MNPFFTTGKLGCVLSVVVLMSGVAAAQEAQPGSDPGASEITWLRHVFSMNQGEDDGQIFIGDSKRLRVWLNGQQLKARTPEDSVCFTVSELLRPGPNCLAVEFKGTSDSLPLAFRVANRKPGKVSFRTKTSQPPVGWQKTDFNHRDWQNSQQSLARVNWQDMPSVPVVEKSTGSRLQDSHFEFRDNDHVLLLGGTFFERAQQFGHLEAGLLTSEAQGLTFRNLGWSADTVFAESRGIFDSPEKGYARMIEHVRSEEPDVVLVHYGQNEPMQESDLTPSDFEAQLNQLITDIQTTGAEVVLVTPHPFLQTPAPLPDARLWNDVLGQFAKSVKDVAKARKCHVVDLFDEFEGRLVAAAEAVGLWRSGLNPDAHSDLKDRMFFSLTDNGMHWNDRGYRCLSHLFAGALFRKSSQALQVKIASSPERFTASVSVAADVQIDQSGDRSTVNVQLHRAWLKPQPFVIDSSDMTLLSCRRETESGARLLDVRSANRQSEDAGYFVDLADDYDQLVRLLIRKNELYFHRWRPQNITYLFGFRKHEQGNNAAEIAAFDPLIDELEKQIHALSQAKGPSLRLEFLQ